MRELVRTLLHDEGYLTMIASDNRYVRHADRVAGRDWTLRIILAVLAAGQIIETIVIAGGHQ